MTGGPHSHCKVKPAYKEPGNQPCMRERKMEAQEDKTFNSPLAET